jgi:acyl carrier protein
MDSVDFVSLVMQVERHYRIHLTHEELRGAVCFGDLVSLVEQKLAATPVAKAA